MNRRNSRNIICFGTPEHEARASATVLFIFTVRMESMNRNEISSSSNEHPNRTKHFLVRKSFVIREYFFKSIRHLFPFWKDFAYMGVAQIESF